MTSNRRKSLIILKKIDNIYGNRVKTGSFSVKKRFFLERGTRKNLERIICGAAVGTANSVFGGGGGMIGVPLLKRLGLKDKGAHATAILLILPVSLSSFILYAIKGLYDFSVLIPTAIGVSLGGFLGAKLLNKLPVKAVNLVFSALQAIAGLFLFFSS